MIRKYQETDCDAVIEIWFAASQVATPFLSDDFLNQVRESIQTMWLPMAETWVLETDNRVVGFLALIGDEVGAIFVLPDSQGRGNGKALMDHAVKLRGDLRLDVFEENSIGRRFYDRYGFQFESRHLHKESGHMQLRLVYKQDEGAAPTPKG